MLLQNHFLPKHYKLILFQLEVLVLLFFSEKECQTALLKHQKGTL